LQEINTLNTGTESKDVLNIITLESLDKNDDSSTKDPDYKFFLAYDFYPVNNYDYHRENLYEFNQGKCNY
jgi:L-ascorbate oxidase